MKNCKAFLLFAEKGFSFPLESSPAGVFGTYSQLNSLNLMFPSCVNVNAVGVEDTLILVDWTNVQ